LSPAADPATGTAATGWTRAVPTGPLATRLVSLEALALLAAARVLIGFVPFARWRRLLGQPVGDGAVSGTAAGDHAAAGADERLPRYLARAVTRASARMELRNRCLPEAMALHWMLKRRGCCSILVLAALPQARRASTDALHAWVEQGGEIRIGLNDQDYRPLLRLGWNRAA
jgi:hypothetical protein